MPRIAIATRDFAGIVRTFRDALGMPVVDLSASSATSLGAKLAFCVPPGGSHIELMSPADPAAPLSQSLERFLERRGDGLFALMLEAPDPDAEAEALAQRGLDVLPPMPGASGRDVHPRSSCGVLIRVYPVDSFEPARHPIERDPARALGLSGIVRVVIAVRDLERALETYAHRLGLEAGEPRPDPRRGVAAALCVPPAGGRIELVAPTDPRQPFAAAIAERLDRVGEGMFALVLQAPDPQAARRALAERGIEPENLFGARLLLEPAS
jgi:catechol 2,3-dioxygenase-like lactoylglutathione lyase family enzyme